MQAIGLRKRGGWRYPSEWGAILPSLLPAVLTEFFFIGMRDILPESVPSPLWVMVLVSFMAVVSLLSIINMAATVARNRAQNAMIGEATLMQEQKPSRMVIKLIIAMEVVCFSVFALVAIWGNLTTPWAELLLAANFGTCCFIGAQTGDWVARRFDN